MNLGENEVKAGVGFEGDVPAGSEDVATRDLGRAGKCLRTLLPLGLASLLAACAQSGTPAPVVDGSAGGPASPPMAANGYGGYGAPASGGLGGDTGVIEGGGGRVTVRPGETLYGVARRMHVPPRVIVEANNLQAPYRLQIGQTISVPHVRQHVVQSGETIASITHRYGGDPATVARLNHTSPSAPLRQGESLILAEGAAAGGTEVGAAPVGVSTPAYLPPPPPSQVQTAAIQPPPPLHETPMTRPGPAGKPVALAPQGGEKQALASPAEAERPQKPETPKKPDKTLAKTEPAKPAAPAETKLDDDDLPGADQPAVKAAPTKPAAAQAPAQASPTSQAQAPTQVAAAAPPPARHAPSGPTFFWPVRGHVIGDFGSGANGTHNDGVNIAAPAGSTVYAAENGTVTYSGNELKGFGNLLLVKHDNGYVSAYAHNQVLLVKKGDHVRRGQPIARVGVTGGVNEPQLHFELRQGVKAVDPLDHLPQLDNQ